MKLKHLNYKVLIGLLVAVTLLGAGAYLLYEVQTHRNADKLLAQVDRAEEKKNTSRAATILERYLRYRPEDTKALARYGLLRADHASSGQAAEAALLVLERVLGRDPGRDDVRRRAIQLSMRLERFPNALSHVKYLEDTKRYPNDGELDQARGICAAADGRAQDAAKYYEEAIEHDPKQIETYGWLGHLYRGELKSTESLKRADQVMDLLVAKNDQSFEAYLSRARYRLAQYETSLKPTGADSTSPEVAKKLDGAEEDINRAVKLNPDNSMVMMVAAQVAANRSDWEGARRLLGHGIEKNPKDARLYDGLAAMESRAGRLDLAEAALARGVKALPADRDMKWKLAEIRIERGTLDQVDEQIEELSSLSYAKEKVDYLKAHARFARQKWDEAAKGFESIAPLLIKNPPLARRVDLMLAHCYTRLGETNRLYETYRRMAAADPTSAEVRSRLAATLESQGRYDDALEQYRMVIKPTAEVDLAIARLLIRRNLRQPASARNWEEVASVLDELEKKAPKDPRVAIFRAEVLVSRDHFDEARALLEKARDANPDRAELWTALIVMAERRGKGEDVLPLLDAAEKQLGDRVELRLLRARSLASRGGPDASKKLDALGHSLEKFPPADRGRLLRGLSEALAQAGDPAKGLALWRPYADEHPRDLNVQFLAFDLALRAGNGPAQDRALGFIRNINESGEALWKYGKARQSIVKARKGDRTELKSALDLLTEVDRLRPNWGKVPASLAEVQDMQGNTDEAVKNYLKAIELGEVDPGLIRRTLRLLTDNRRFDEVNTVLAKLQDQTTIYGDMQRLASELISQKQDLNRALELAEKAVESGSADYRDHAWLAQIRWMVGRRAEAEAPMRKAIELAGDDLTPLVSLVQLLVSSGKKAEAERAIAEAEKRPSAKEYRTALARCYETVNRSDRARTLLEQAMKEEPDDSSNQQAYISFLIRRGLSKEAEPHLERLIKLEDKSPKDAEWARRVLASLLAPARDPERAQRALELLGMGGGDDDPASLTPIPLDRLRTQARVLAMQAAKGRSAEAIRYLEEVVRRAPRSAQDQLVLARLYEIEGDWPKAAALMRQTIEQNQSNPAYRIRYILALLRNKQAAEAGPSLDELEKLRPDAPLVYQLRAMALSDQGKGAEAEQLLRQFAQKHKDQAGFAAQVLELLGRAPAAEEVLRRHIEQNQAKDPKAILVLAEFLGRQGRTREALDLCERAWKTSPPGTVADVCCSILLTADPDVAQVSRVEGWFKAAIARQPAVLQLQVAMAMLRTVQGRYPEAETIYRDALAKDPDNIVALNNLAWMIAIKQKKGAEALKLLGRAIEIAGPRGPLLDTRAVIHLTMGQSDLAISDLEAAIAESPIAPMYFHLAQAYMIAKRPDDAKTAMQDGRRLGLKPNSLDPLERPAYSQLVAELERK